MDGEFGHLHGEMASMGVTLNETSWDEHVGDIERFIRTIEEWMRQCTTPYHSTRSLQGWLWRWQRHACSG